MVGLSIKESLKKSDFLRVIVKRIKIYREYLKDAKIFSKYYMEGIQQQTQLEYKILLKVHSLEKGMCLPLQRPFGYEKCKDLIDYLTTYKNLGYDLKTTAYQMGNAIIEKWLNLYKNNGWPETDNYLIIKSYLKNSPMEIDKRIIVGCKVHIKPEIISENNFANVINSRYSVRDFSKKPLAEADVIECVEMAIKAPTACNRQMCKIYSIKNNTSKDLLTKELHGTGGFNISTVNYFVVTFDLAAFDFYGERNQGYLNSGLVAMNFANALHNKGIGSCFMQLGNTFDEEKRIKRTIGIPENERIAVILGTGYYKDESVIPCSCRKTVEEVLVNCSSFSK